MQLSRLYPDAGRSKNQMGHDEPGEYDQVIVHGGRVWGSQSPWSLVSRLSASDLAYSAHHDKITIRGVQACAAHCSMMPCSQQDAEHQASNGMDIAFSDGPFLAFQTCVSSNFFRTARATTLENGGKETTSAPRQARTTLPAAKTLGPGCCLPSSDYSQMQPRKSPAPALRHACTGCNMLLSTRRRSLAIQVYLSPDTHRAGGRGRLS